MNEEAIILMEPGAEVSDEQLNRLASDANLRQACEDIFVAGSLLAREQTDKPDVEASLRRFHERHLTPALSSSSTLAPSHSRTRYLWTAVAAAAVVAAVFILRFSHRTPASSSSLSPQNIVFAAAEGRQQVSVQTENGKDVPVSIVRDEGHADATLVVDKQKVATAMEIDEHYSVSVPYGESLYMLLDDGTRVFLHPGSRLVYPTRFAGSSREVQFSGEAYFCVAKDAKRPFIVHTIEGDIRVYGTEFNVNSGKRSEVVLVEGSVGVTPMDGNEQVIMPGQKLSILNSQMSVEDVDVEPYISWRDGYFHFEEETLGHILQTFGRYYNLNVVCNDPGQLSCRMRFIIPRNRDAAYCVQMLNRMGKARVSLRNNNLVVEPV